MKHSERGIHHGVLWCGMAAPVSFEFARDGQTSCAAYPCVDSGGQLRSSLLLPPSDLVLLYLRASLNQALQEHYSLTHSLSPLSFTDCRERESGADGMIRSRRVSYLVICALFLQMPRLLSLPESFCFARFSLPRPSLLAVE